MPIKFYPPPAGRDFWLNYSRPDVNRVMFVKGGQIEPFTPANMLREIAFWYGPTRIVVLQ